jgi:serine/threonine protein kinase
MCIVDNPGKGGDLKAMTMASTSMSPRSRASRAAYEITQRFSKQSKLSVLEERIHPLHWNDVKPTSLLGKGAFSEVYRVDISKPAFKDKKCALKFLSSEIIEIAEGDFDLAAIDLAMEADLLSRLKHENIITLHGIYGGALNSSYIDSTRGYFLILDLLEDTLPKRLRKCRAKARLQFSKTVSTEKVVQRIDNVALGIANGMEYLHENGVIFRDLKPHNIGFNRDGHPVIFDFGFARELHTLHKDEVAGSLRYMSPEMAYGQAPSLPSDVYSFGVLLYEICTLKTPFKQFKSRPDFSDNVLVGGYRPSLSSISSKIVQSLISRSWDSDPTKRPDMATIVKDLKFEMALYYARNESGSHLSDLGNPSRRTSLINFKPAGFNSSFHSSFSKRSSFRAEGVSLVSSFRQSEEVVNVVSDLSSPGSSSKRDDSRKSRVSHASFSSMCSDSSVHSNDSHKASEYSLGKLRKPFKRISGSIISTFSQRGPQAVSLSNG